ncbi:hypothetical protein CSB68_4137 (plasmid) [Acinetobacter baumannii]|nr:hypothetical protein CSB68_4137 [Acinetobacter baumannii]
MGISNELNFIADQFLYTSKLAETENILLHLEMFKKEINLHLNILEEIDLISFQKMLKKKKFSMYI